MDIYMYLSDDHVFIAMEVHKFKEEITVLK